MQMFNTLYSYVHVSILDAERLSQVRILLHTLFPNSIKHVASYTLTSYMCLSWENVIGKPTIYKQVK